jgi:hypothetical protein
LQPGHNERGYVDLFDFHCGATPLMRSAALTSRNGAYLVSD